MNLLPLIQILHKEQKIHEKLLLAKREEQKWIATANAGQLIKNTSRISDLADEARQAEAQRRALVNQLAKELEIGREEPTLKEIVETLPPAQRIEVEQAGEELKKTVLEIKKLNQANHIILQRSVETMQEELAQIVKTEESGVYTATGAKDTRVAPRAGLNLRA